eukprot:9408415-Prorocentrum_lima.AAC.1
MSRPSSTSCDVARHDPAILIAAWILRFLGSFRCPSLCSKAPKCSDGGGDSLTPVLVGPCKVPSAHCSPPYGCCCGC